MTVRTTCSFVFALTVMIPVVAILLQKVLFAGLMEAPPPDYGSGSMFDVIAKRYDFVNRVLALGMDISWRQRMVHVIHDSIRNNMQEQNIQQPQILDLATGTADVALLLGKEIPYANIVGVDPSQQMLSLGNVKIQQQHLENIIRLQIADAQQLTSVLEDDTFDAATMAFGIRNVPDRSKALCEIHRVLKPNARFCILEFSEPDDTFGVLGRIARLFIRHVVPFLGSVLSGAPREYWHLQNSIKDFPSPQIFSEQISSLECATSTTETDADGANGNNKSFTVEEIIQMNFGSVQLYVLKSNKAVEDEQQQQQQVPHADEETKTENSSPDDEPVQDVEPENVESQQSEEMGANDAQETEVETENVSPDDVPQHNAESENQESLHSEETDANDGQEQQ